ncbi:MAG: head-tail connector protein [Sutterella wadsworthensis]|nr:head-tail connector protein [Sutterella wadsworthensis]
MIDTSTAKSAVTLEDAKLHLRVDHSADDALIEALCLSATQMAEHELQRGLISREGTAGYGAEPSDVPAAIRQWILIQVAHYYEHREATVEGAVTPLPKLHALLDPFRTWK